MGRKLGTLVVVRVGIRSAGRPRNRPPPFEMDLDHKKPRTAPRLFAFEFSLRSSVAVTADANAHAWSAETDAATLFIASASIASALVITASRSVSI